MDGNTGTVSHPDQDAFANFSYTTDLQGTYALSTLELVNRDDICCVDQLPGANFGCLARHHVVGRHPHGWIELRAFGAPIPEPSVTVTGLFALTGLVLRRRRA